jgi:hypothetical protein
LSLSCGVAAGIGAGTGLGVAMGNVGEGAFGFVGAEVGSGGSVDTGGTRPLVGDGAGVRVGAGVGVDAGVGVLGGGVFGLGIAPGAPTVVDDPAGSGTSTPSAVVSTVPEIVTTVVSPPGETLTYESDPARMTDAIPALRTS